MLKGVKEEYPFLKESSHQSLIQSIHNMDTAYQNFFKHVFELLGPYLKCASTTLMDFISVNIMLRFLSF